MERIGSLVLVVLYFGCMGVCRARYGFVTSEGGSLKISTTDYYADIPDVHVARATYTNEINKTGWAFLELHTTDGVPNEQQAYSAGYLEGYLTRDLIWMHWQNMLKGYCYNKTDLCWLIEQYVDTNENYILDMIEAHPSDPYWHQLKLYYNQVEGVAAGYNQATESPYEQLTNRDIVWINMLGDMDELALSLSMPRDSAPDLFRGDSSERCSGLVKLLPGLRDLYTSHATWNSYQSMLRIQKMYVLNYKMTPRSRVRIPGYKMSFTSYPAFVQSTDDFYIISTGLVPAETTTGNSNRSLFELVQPVGQVLEYARAMIANRLARDGKEWCDLFRRYNSGTYNNQWYIVDYNKFREARRGRPGAVKPGLLWVIEQLPGTTEQADLTDLLLKTSYFPSYNIPYFPRIFNLSGGWVRVETFGDWFGYDTNPRAAMFKQKQADIYNLRDMFWTMRYNDFKHDPLARCACDPPYSGCNAIAARNDLNPANGTYPFRALGHRSHGSTDAKVTSARLRRHYQFVSVASPAHNEARGIPPFQWSKFDLGTKISHKGHPDRWVFPPLLHLWEWQ